MPERIRSLQTLRFLAITLVFLSHCSFIVGPTGGALFSSAGAFGVSVFICLSGFLTFIARSGKGAAPAPIFGLRRVGKKIWKFYPLHVVTFLAALPLATFALSGGLVSRAEALVAVINLCLLQSWVPDSAVYFSFNAVSWFLSTYVLMIIATPFLMRLIACLKRGRKEAHRSVFVGAIAALAIIEFFLAAVSDGWSHAHWLLYIFPPVRLLDFGAGMLLGSLYCESDRFNSRTARKTFLGGGLSAMLAVAACVAYKAQVGAAAPACFYSAIWLVPTLLIIGLFVVADRSGLSCLLGFTPLVALGNISMEFFLVHQLVLRYVSRSCDVYAAPLVAAAVCYALAWVLSWGYAKADDAIRGAVRTSRS